MWGDECRYSEILALKRKLREIAFNEEIITTCGNEEVPQISFHNSPYSQNTF